MGGKVSDENFIVIQGWMITNLKLKGNELIIYAIIYGFSQAEGQVFNGSLQYLAEWTNSTKQGVSKSLKSLVEKKFISKNDKYINGVKFCEYYATKFNGVCNKVEQGIQQSLIPPMQQSLTNNINLDNIEDNIINIKEIKKKYGEYQNVKLTEKEYNSLVSEYGSSTDEIITYLDEYIEMKGTKYKSCYLAIRKWVAKAVKEKKNKPNTSYPNQRKEIVPDWLYKDIKKEEKSEEEQKAFEEEKEKLEKMLKEFY
jgi:predicted transcriptional regulator